MTPRTSVQRVAVAYRGQSALDAPGRRPDQARFGIRLLARADACLARSAATCAFCGAPTRPHDALRFDLARGQAEHFHLDCSEVFVILQGGA